MSSGTGNAPLDDLINVTTQVFSIGMIGYGGEGATSKSGGKKGFGAGWTGAPAMDVTKEITGAKAAEEANAMARDQFDKSVEQAKQQRVEAQAANQRTAIQNSQNAAGARSTNTNISGSRKPIVGDVTDFLGI